MNVAYKYFPYTFGLKLKNNNFTVIFLKFIKNFLQFFFWNFPQNIVIIFLLTWVRILPKFNGIPKIFLNLLAIFLTHINFPKYFLNLNFFSYFQCI